MNLYVTSSWTIVPWTSMIMYFFSVQYSMCKKVSKSVGIMYKLRDFLPFSCLRMLYYSLIYPYLLYCINIWGGAYASHLNPLIILQKRAIRVICNAPYLGHSTPLFYATKILKLVDIYKYNLSIYMFDHHQNPEFHRNHSYSTRNRTNLIPPFERLSTTQHSVSYNGCKVWNDLPPNLRTIESNHILKIHLKKYLLNKYLPI